MKSLAELEALKNKKLEDINLRKDRENGVRVVVGMATCGIAAGARPVLNGFMDEITKRSLANVTITQTGCIGMCRLEPIVEVYSPGREKVTYVKVTPDMIPHIVAEHIVNNMPVAKYTIGAVEE